MSLGKLWLLPVPLATEVISFIPSEVQQRACSIKHFFVENIRTARRFLKAFDATVNIDEIQFEEINKQQQPDLAVLKKWLQAGLDVGLMSEAGCPGIADPGNILVKVAHEIGATVCPMVGPSSILLALMGSGFNGQSFRFLGYLPVKEPMRGKEIKEIEQISAMKNETQIFIETPFRNKQLLEELVRNCHPHKTKLCIAIDLTATTQEIYTKTVNEWKSTKVDLHKRPAVFLLHSF